MEKPPFVFKRLAIKSCALPGAWLLLLLVTTTIGCGQRAAVQTPVSETLPPIQIQDWRAAAGYAHYFEVANHKLEIVLRDDFGTPPKVLFSRALSADDTLLLKHAFNAAGVDSLLDNYTDPKVIDGQYMRLRLPTRTGALRTIVLENAYPAELLPLVNLLSQWSPAKYKIHYGEQVGADSHGRQK